MTRLRLPAPPRIALLAFLLALGFGVAAGPALAVDLETALTDLDTLNKHIKKRTATNDDLIQSIEAVSAAYKGLQPPPEPEYEAVPEGASDEERIDVERRNRKKKDEWQTAAGRFERESAAFRDDVEKALLKALALERTERSNPQNNTRMDVNVRAARALAATGNPDVARGIRGVLERTIFKAKYTVPQLLLEETFAALGTLNDHDALKWMVDEFIHTKSSPPIEVDKLNAAHKAMVLFKGVDGRLRHEIVKAMTTTYAATEASAESNLNSSDPAKRNQALAAKQFWDRIKNDALRVVHYYTLEQAKDPDTGQAYATMGELREWFRRHDNPRRAPWTAVEPDPDAGG